METLPGIEVREYSASDFEHIEIRSSRPRRPRVPSALRIAATLALFVGAALCGATLGVLMAL